tara:strand:- start:1782 stop:1976 length:195 start_codon:yes stop_codon:yes gene_type:complete
MQMFESPVTDGLINKLKDAFPSIPLRSMSHREVDHLIGNQEVIAYLIMLKEEYENNEINLNEGV